MGLIPSIGRPGVIQILNVDQAYHGRGIGGALLEAALEDMKKRRFDYAFLQTKASNKDARRLYERRGFKLIFAAEDCHYSRRL